MRQWHCLRCGMVREGQHAPICRHYALDLPASWMVPLPTYHPCYKPDSMEVEQ